MIFGTINAVGQSNEQNATNASLLNVFGGNQITIQGAENHASVWTGNAAIGNVVFNVR